MVGNCHTSHTQPGTDWCDVYCNADINYWGTNVWASVRDRRRNNMLAYEIGVEIIYSLIFIHTWSTSQPQLKSFTQHFYATSCHISFRWTIAKVFLSALARDVFQSRATAGASSFILPMPSARYKHSATEPWDTRSLPSVIAEWLIHDDDKQIRVRWQVSLLTVLW